MEKQMAQLRVDTRIMVALMADGGWLGRVCQWGGICTMAAQRVENGGLGSFIYLVAEQQRASVLYSLGCLDGWDRSVT